jgi:hypothetical protein
MSIWHYGEFISPCTSDITGNLTGSTSRQYGGIDLSFTCACRWLRAKLQPPWGSIHRRMPWGNEGEHAVAEVAEDHEPPTLNPARGRELRPPAPQERVVITRRWTERRPRLSAQLPSQHKPKPRQEAPIEAGPALSIWGPGTQLTLGPFRGCLVRGHHLRRHNP